jgi:hypothetical protein
MLQHSINLQTADTKANIMLMNYKFKITKTELYLFTYLFKVI